MVELPEFENTASRMLETYVIKQKEQPPRPHLGASQIGRPCEREIWYGFRWIMRVDFPARVLRLFDTGKLEENRIINDLTASGVEIYPFNIHTGRQFSMKLYGGHFGGSLDGIGRGFVEAPKTWHLTEFKTHNDKSFAKLQKEGVREAKPEHWAQMQVYMGLTHEPEYREEYPLLERAMYIAVNKNNDDIYSERIEYSKEAYEGLKNRARRIIFSEKPPARISELKTCFGCKFCDYKSLCHAAPGEEFPKPLANCRTCLHVTPMEDGTWHCSRHNRVLGNDEQLIGCGKHLYIPSLLPYGEPIDVTQAPTTVVYEDGMGGTITNKEGGRLE